jgi:putative hydrolase of the HAD superfamily
VNLALRAVIFDYGMVLSGPPDPEAHAELVRITGLPAEQLDPLYWADRIAFDAGTVSGQEFWRRIAQEARLNLSETAIGELAQWDARMWMTVNQAMLAWQQKLKESGLRTAIISNLGDTVHDAMAREFKWLSQFDVLVWSYQLRLVKPDPAIYRYALDKLGTLPEEALFIDDRQENVDTAIETGMKGLVFSTVERLRADLVATGLGEELPLPART